MRYWKTSKNLRSRVHDPLTETHLLWSTQRFLATVDYTPSSGTLPRQVISVCLYVKCWIGCIYIPCIHICILYTYCPNFHIYIYICIYVRVCIYVYIHIYVHIYIYILILICMLPRFSDELSILFYACEANTGLSSHGPCLWPWARDG